MSHLEVHLIDEGQRARENFYKAIDVAAGGCKSARIYNTLQNVKNKNSTPEQPPQVGALSPEGRDQVAGCHLGTMSPQRVALLTEIKANSDFKLSLT